MKTNGVLPKARLLPQIVDDLARDQPTKIFASLPKTNDISDGCRDVTAHEFATAVNRAAWFLAKQLGQSHCFETLTYIGPSDLRYPILSLAAPKVGYKMFWTSPRNSFEGHASLIEATQSKIFLTPAVVPPGIETVIKKAHMYHLVIPELSDWLDSTAETPPYLLTKTYDESYLQPYMIIHTSGSTGLPKPIVLPFGFFSVSEAYVADRPEDGSKTMYAFVAERPGRAFHPFPMFHGGGIYVFFLMALVWNNIPVLAPDRPLTPELADAYHRSGHVTSTFLPPATLEGISRVPAFLENLRNLQLVMFSGAQLSYAVGEKLRQKTRLINFIGQTESGALHQLYVEDEDYMYIRFAPRANIEFRHHAEDLYEAVVVRKEGLECFQPAFMVFPKLQELGMNDLFSRHPDPKKADHWLHRGRADDIIVFETGEKINPVTMEHEFEHHPLVRSAMVVGEGRFQASVLIELLTGAPQPGEENLAILEEMWTIAERANIDIPAHGRLVKQLIVFTDPDKPMLRSGKGAIQRRLTTRLYQDKLDEAYATADDISNANGPLLDPGMVSDKLLPHLRQIVLEIGSFPALEDDDDFFHLGMDSLQMLELSRSLKVAFRKHPECLKKISPGLIYANPTLRNLCGVLTATAVLATDANGTKVTQNGTGGRDRLRELNEVYLKYSSGLPTAKKHVELRSSNNRKSVILTGSTGGLGSYVLASLMSSNSVAHIYCLNRSEDGMKRQATISKARGLPIIFDPSKVTFLKCSFSVPDLGIEQSAYADLIRTATHIIHNAWTVDFNLGLSSLAPTNVAGVRHLIDLAGTAKHRVHFFFVSSMGTVMQWNAAGNDGPVPEELVDDPAVVQPIGYTESKYVAERLLTATRAQSNISTYVLRVGQIAGPVHRMQGEWTRAEWLPTLVASSVVLGLVPNNIGELNTVDWVPVDILAEAVVELIDCDADAEGEGVKVPVYNLVNSARTTWKEVYPVILRCLNESSSAGKPVKAVSYDQWLAALRTSAVATRTEEEINRNPGVKLLEFFESLVGDMPQGPEFATERTLQKSKALRECGPVTTEWMQLWMKQWKF